jgi:TPP-dependent pyruvate/acetoin dehydrogenase alpha subunit
MDLPRGRVQDKERHAASSPGADLAQMYRSMFLIRSFEAKVNDLFLKGQIPGTIHLSRGQESVAVGIACALREIDILIPTHRGHGHALAKGMEPKALFAELLARADGCCGGKGGSLHIGDVAKGIMPPSPVVGSSVPVAAGIAFSFRYRGEDRVVASLFGDGAVNTGPLHEGINLAAIWRLPVVFVCENNQYAISTPVQSVVSVSRLSDRAAGYGIPGLTVDGNDVLAVYEAARDAVDRARAGDGPTFLECVTYRHGGHKRDDPATYRPKEEVERWMALDGLPRARQRLVEESSLTEEQIVAMEQEVEAGLRVALDEALESPEPAIESALSDVYA